MLKIGCTSGIGAGKSTICQMFKEKFGIPIYDMDIRAKELIVEQPYLRDTLVEHFGMDTFLRDGSYNTKFISNIIFNNKDEKEWMKHTIGKYIKADYEEWQGLKERKGYSYVILESAILFETKCENWVDLIIGVSCNKIIRIERVQKRNNFTLEQVLERMNNQMLEEDKLSLCDFIVNNDGEQELGPQLDNIHRVLLKIFAIGCKIKGG